MMRYLVILCVLVLAIRSFAATELKTNTATILTVGPFLDYSDGVSPEVAMTVTNITCELYVNKNDGSAPSRTAITLAASGSNNDMVHITDDVAGCYSVELTAAQLNFLGSARLCFTDPDVMCPVWEDLRVLPANHFDSMIAGTDVLQVDVEYWYDTVVGALGDTDDQIEAVQDALTNQGLTTTRADYLDNLTAVPDIVVDVVQALGTRRGRWH